ncbi:protein of unknown function [Paenibacillus alvei]|uniref:Uncharacterized protein n=1 Tax=Paenibacillus alvei TaxID=44250 RepID=A0A383RFT2_PAEAL|nr:protein of unknown function [Paenibacillus alvei]
MSWRVISNVRNKGVNQLNISVETTCLLSD